MSNAPLGYKMMKLGSRQYVEKKYIYRLDMVVYYIIKMALVVAFLVTILNYSTIFYWMKKPSEVIGFFFRLYLIVIGLMLPYKTYRLAFRFIFR